MLHVGITGVVTGLADRERAVCRVAGLGVSYEMETRNRSIRKMPNVLPLNQNGPSRGMGLGPTF